MEGRAVSPPSFRIFISMRTIATVFLLFAVSSCIVEQNLVDTDDLYITKHYDIATRNYSWYENRRTYVYPSYWNPYPYEMIVVRPIVVVPRIQEQYQTGKRPDRGSLPNHNGNQTTPRRGRN